MELEKDVQAREDSSSKGAGGAAVRENLLTPVAQQMQLI